MASQRARTLLNCGLLILLLTAAAQAGALQSVTEPRLQVRLQTHLTTYGSRPGTPFQCVVICPFEVGGQVLIPAGSIVYGTVRRALPVHLGLRRERAVMELSFTAYQSPGGVRLPLSAKLVSIDNAREEVTAKGRINGILAATNPDEVLNGIWRTPSLNMFYRPFEGLTGVGQEVLEKFPIGPIGPAVLLGLRCFILRFPEPEIHLPPGADMELAVDRTATQFYPEAPAVVPDVSQELQEWLQTRPTTIERADGRRADDLINVVFTGSQGALQEAFYNAGWYAAEPTTLRSFSRLYVAFNGKKTYSTAPVSKLLYQGRAPDFVFEKSFDTVSKRHHVRIWNAGFVNGEQIWLGAATHDTGVRFNGKAFWFTHRIDRNIDAERSKISTDLTFAGCSQPASYVSREDETENDPAALVTTDGRVAVLALQSCESGDASDSTPAPAPPGNKVTRFIRRVMLESRSYVLRENAYYWAYQMFRYHGDRH